MTETTTRTIPPATSGAWTAFTIVVAISLLSVFSLSDADQTPAASQQGVNSGGDLIEVGPDVASEDVAAGGTAGPRTSRRVVGGSGGDGGDAGTAGADGGAGGSGAQGNYDCTKGQNGGATAPGVSEKEIRLAATVVKSGIAKDFLADAQFGIEAVRQKVNAEGGICGRLLKVVYEDDVWRTDEGARIIQKWIGQGDIFGLAVNPSSEGLRGAIRGGLIRENEFPAVGADGMLIGQYKDPWVWPVATSTHSVMHIMAQEAWSRGARKFGIVWESDYRFGEEGFNSFSGLIKDLGGTVHDVEIQSGQIDYANKAKEFLDKCGDDFGECDFVAMLLEPATAINWVKSNGLGNGNTQPKHGLGAPQPLFLRSFATNCGKPCANMRVWTSFKPPIEPFDTDPAVVTYLNDLRGVSTSADAANPHVQGAYVGMQLLVEALKQLGGAPTRTGLRDVLDQMTFDSKLTPPLTYRPGNHFAAVSAQAFQAVYKITEGGADFEDWRYTGSGFIQDENVSKHQLQEE